MNGLNGTIMLNTGPDGLTVGKVPGAAYGYKRSLKVTVDVRIERLERHATYQTTGHEQVTGPLSLTVTTNVWQPGGGDIVAGPRSPRPCRARSPGTGTARRGSSSRSPRRSSTTCARCSRPPPRPGWFTSTPTCEVTGVTCHDVTPVIQLDTQPDM
jgi:hypothetical protein